MLAGPCGVSIVLFILRPFFFRVPHSFPTRRSSDLPSEKFGTHSISFSMLNRAAWARSEEHTSELQSPMYLVCRLLLEKKKKKKKKKKIIDSWNNSYTNHNTMIIHKSQCNCLM